MLSGLIRRLVAGGVVAGAALVAVLALGLCVYFALALVLVPFGAAAVTALIFAIVAGGVAMAFFGRAYPDDDDEDEDDHEGLGARAFHLIRQRPILGVAAALAGGFILLRNPALATLAAAAFADRGHSGRGSSHRRRRR